MTVHAAVAQIVQLIGDQRELTFTLYLSAEAAVAIVSA